jgi:hypothetical protein
MKRFEYQKFSETDVKEINRDGSMKLGKTKRIYDNWDADCEKCECRACTEMRKIKPGAQL